MYHTVKHSYYWGESTVTSTHYNITCCNNYYKGTILQIEHYRTSNTIILVCIDVYIYKYEKHFQKMYRDVGMAVPKTTETRCRDGSVQGRHVIQRLHN